MTVGGGGELIRCMKHMKLAQMESELMIVEEEFRRGLKNYGD